MGVGELAQLASSVPGGPADPDIFDPWIKFATKRCAGILMIGGWNLAQIRAMVADDDDLRLAFAMVGASMIGARKPAFRQTDGTFPFSAQGKMGKDFLDEKAKTKERIVAELEDPAVGLSPRLASSVLGSGKKFFVNNGNGPGPGGF